MSDENNESTKEVSGNNNKNVQKVGTNWLLGIDRILTPTCEFLGDELKKWIEKLINTRLKEAKEEFSKENIQGNYLVLDLHQIESTQNNTYELINFPSPFESFPDWSWPLKNADTTKHMERILPERNDIDVDRNLFLNNLCRSFSLNGEEKRRVINAYPMLSQFQIDALQEVFLEEREKFSILYNKDNINIWRIIYKLQKQWGRLILNDNWAGDLAFLIPPVEGKFMLPSFMLWDEFWAYLGRDLCNDLQQYNYALAAFEMALNLHPKSAYVWSYKRLCLIKMKRYSLAIEAIKECINISPGNKYNYLELIELYIVESDYKNAILTLEKHSEKFSELPYKAIYLFLSIVAYEASNKNIDNLVNSLQLEINKFNWSHTWNFSEVIDWLKDSNDISPEQKKNIVETIKLLKSHEEINI